MVKEGDKEKRCERNDDKWNKTFLLLYFEKTRDNLNLLETGDKKDAKNIPGREDTRREVRV